MIVIRTVLVNGSTFSSQTRLEQLLGRDDRAVGASSASSTPNSFGREAEVRAAARGGVARRVELDVAARAAPAAGPRRRGAERVHARDELGEAERLAEVVVGAEREPVDELVGRAGRGQHQDLQLGLLVAQRAAHVVAVHRRGGRGRAGRRRRGRRAPGAARRRRRGRRRRRRRAGAGPWRPRRRRAARPRRAGPASELRSRRCGRGSGGGRARARRCSAGRLCGGATRLIRRRGPSRRHHRATTPSSAAPHTDGRPWEGERHASQ